MLKNIVAALVCAAAPAALLANPVELRSTDGFISVEGDVVGFNGVMVSVATSVGLVSVPASEVVCFGPGCLTLIATNDFGLSEDAFEGVVGEAPATPLETFEDDLTVGIADPFFDTVFTTLAGTFAVASETTSSVDLGTVGQVTIQNEAGNEVATLTKTSEAAAGDVVIDTVALSGALAAEYPGPFGWSSTNQLGHQMIGLRAFTVVVSPDVEVSVISMDDLASIYAGDITNWSALGGPDKKILPLQLPVNSLARNELISIVMEPAGKTISSNVLTMADQASIATSVNQFPGGISVVDNEVASDNTSLAISGTCGVPVLASEFNILSGDYPLIRPIMARYDRVPTTTLVADLFNFAGAKVTRELLAREGLFDQNPIQQDSTAKNRRIGQILNANLAEAELPIGRQMFQALFEAERLTPTLFGGPVSGPEGAWNRAMFNVLAETLQGEEFAGREVFFAGYADSAGGTQAALDASVDAAANMEAAFARFASGVISGNSLRLGSAGFGSVAPATCYDGQVAGDTHSRVEVWIR